MFNSFKERFDRTPKDLENRVPPGQYVTEKFPVLHYGEVPRYHDMAQWDLRIWGELEESVTFSCEQVCTLPTIHLTTDIHCVTRWSKLGTHWEGVQFRELLNHIPALKPGAAFVVAHAEQGYTANLPLEVLMDDDVLLAYKYDHKELEPEHGYPLRLLVPRKYFWKSVKWLRGLEFVSEDRPGFWERYGYNNNADPWKEERYADS